MKICPNCFIQNKESATKCYECGFNLENNTNQEHFDDYIIEPMDDLGSKDLLYKDEVILDLNTKPKRSYKFEVDSDTNESFFNKDDAGIFLSEEGDVKINTDINNLVEDGLIEEVDVNDSYIEDGSFRDALTGETIEDTIEMDETEQDLFIQKMNNISEEKTEIIDDMLDDL